MRTKSGGDPMARSGAVDFGPLFKLVRDEHDRADVSSMVSAQRGSVYAAVLSSGIVGMKFNAIVQATGLTADTTRARLFELVDRSMVDQFGDVMNTYKATHARRDRVANNHR